MLYLYECLVFNSIAEAPSHQPSASTSRIPNGPPRTHARTNSFSSSVSTRTTQSRTTSSSSFSQTVGSGSRAATSRPLTSMGQRRPGASSIARPYTSLDTHEEESPSSVLGKRKGRQHFPKSYQVTPGSYDKYMNCTIQLTPCPSPSHTPIGPLPQRREPSISTLMSKLSLSEPKDTPIEQATLANKARKIPLPSGNTRVPLRQAKSTCQLTYTPPRRKPKSLQKTPSAIVPFLTKSSQLKAWEHDTRLQELETFADTFFSKISQVGQNSDVMKDAINLYKSRGTYFYDDRGSSLTTHSGGARKEPGRNYGQQLHASY